MSRIFLSHSSKDDFAAVAIHDWLNENGWDDVFLDLDPAEGIHPGERWERALHEHAVRCEVVLFLVSRHWLESDWCRREFELARKLNKRIFVLLIDDLTISELPFYLTQTQAVSLASGGDHEVRRVVLPGTHEERHVTLSSEGLARLKTGLTQAGLDPRFFAWPPVNEPNRSPYRGLEPLESVDAGIFFGRDAPVIEALDSLRGLREAACPRLFIIIGASGAGKSSFLRAGLLPRLTRDDRSFLPLPVVRPERSAVNGVNGLVTALATACNDKGIMASRAQLREAAALGADALRPHLRSLAAKAQADSATGKPPTLVVAVDQAEELFRAEGATEGEALLALLRDLVGADDPAVIALFVIRSDSYDALEHAKPLEGLSQKAFPLLPMPRGAYQTVIEGPAGRLVRTGRKFEIDPSLTEALLADLEKGGGSDALPLLAFTLEQLFSDHAGAGRLSRADYESFGGVKGAIDAAAARVFAAADHDVRIPKDREARLALLRRGLIPWLAGIDPETKTPRRRRAPAAQIPEEARPLIDLLVEHRLLTRAVDETTHVTTLEPAHEALLRQWGNLKGWLDEDFVRLVTLEGVKRAARDWDANARDPAWAAHGGARLEDATRLDSRPDLAALLDANDRAYLAACREREIEAQAKERALAMAERRAAQRTRLGLAVSSALAVLAIIAAIFGFRQAQDAKQQTLNAEQRSAVLAASVSQSFTEEGALDQAFLLMLDAARVFSDATVPDEIRIALTKALKKRERVETRTLFPNMQTFETDSALVLVNPATKDIWALTDSIVPKRLVTGSPDDSPVLKLQQSLNGQSYIVLRENRDVDVIDAASGARKQVGALPDLKKMPGAAYELDDTKIADDGLIIRDYFVTRGDQSSVLYQIFDPESGRAAEGEASGIARILRKRPGGGYYALDTDEHLVAVVAGPRGLVVSRPKLSQQDGIYARYGKCVADMASAAQKSVTGDLDEAATGAGSYFQCKTVASGYLLEEVSSGSAGESRSDELFRPNGHKIDIRDTLKAALTEPMSDNNVAWVGGYPATQSLAKKLKAEWLGILLNRNAYVLEHDTTSGNSDGSESWSLLLNYRHPTFVGGARFIGPDQIVVVEGESGRIVAHDFGTEPKENFFTTPLDHIVGGEAPVEKLLHPGTCVGYATPRTKSAKMPDGRTLTFDTSSITESADKHELDISGPKPMVVALGDDATCIQFSSDWTRMLVVKETKIDVYDFQRILQTGTLAGSETSTLPANRPGSAFFLDPAGQTIVTANYTNRVLLWRQDADHKTWGNTEIYKGDNEIYYAEPDASGDRLILIEQTGGGGVHGVLYSLGAREVWFDLGSDYKWFGATFTDDSNIVVSEHFKWTRVVPMPSLSALTSVAEKKLSPECRPPSERDYRHSPCWPASYR